MFRLKNDGLPDLRRVRADRATHGRGWIGLARREAYDVRGVSFGALAPGWAFFLIAALFALGAWRVEGR